MKENEIWTGMIKEYNENATLARFVMHSDNQLFSGLGLSWIQVPIP